MVVALDAQPDALASDPADFAGARRVCGTAEQLPFADATFDLAFSQFALLWMDVPGVVGELRRILEPGGVFVAIEPDYGGMIEEPAALRSQEIWQRALREAGADPNVGRRLPRLLAEQQFDVRVELVPEISPPGANDDRFEFLRELPLTEEDRRAIERLSRAEQERAGSWSRLVYVPMLLVTAVAPRAVNS